MIGRITGKISEKMTGALLVGAGPIDYEIFVATEDWGAAKVGATQAYYIYEQIREDAHNLFGFTALEARELFVSLLGVSGVGPKVALAVLSAASVGRLKQAIAGGDSDILKGVAGVGKKTAERIIVELRGKLKDGEYTDLSTSGDSTYHALLGLGYNVAQAASAAAAVPSSVKGEQARIKAALKVVQ